MKYTKSITRKNKANISKYIYGTSHAVENKYYDQLWHFEDEIICYEMLDFEYCCLLELFSF